MYHVAVHTRKDGKENAVVLTTNTERQAIEWANRIPDMLGFVVCTEINEALWRSRRMMRDLPGAYGKY